MEYILSVVLFAISSSVTPGPNNIMVMTSGLNFGVRRSLPLLGGICLGFALMLLMVGLGFAQLFSLFPSLSMLVKVVGTLYLLYLAWLIAISRDVGQSSSHTQPFGFIKGALFQWVNAKAWVVAIGAISAFTTVGEQFALQNLTIATTFLIVSFPCVGVWLLFGSLLKRYLSDSRYLRGFNLTMAALLVLSVLPVVREIITTLTL